MMNASLMLLVITVTLVKKPFSTIHHAKKIANVILMVQLLWIVITMVNALAEWDMQEENVMNANQIILVTNVMHVNPTSLIIHLVMMVCPNNLLG